MICVCPCTWQGGGSHQDGLVLICGSTCPRTGLGSGIGLGPSLLSHVTGWAYWVGYLIFRLMGLGGGVEGKGELGCERAVGHLNFEQQSPRRQIG